MPGLVAVGKFRKESFGHIYILTYAHRDDACLPRRNNQCTRPIAIFELVLSTIKIERDLCRFLQPEIELCSSVDDSTRYELVQHPDCERVGIV